MKSKFELFIFIYLCIIGALLGVFIGSIIKLSRYNNCYINNFELDYCEKYKDY